MSISYQAKSSAVLGRQLSVQEVSFTCSAVGATSDATNFVSINNATIADTVITVDIGEPIEKCYSVEVKNRATGATVALEAVPSTAVANKISAQIDGTSQTDLCVTVKYKVQE